MTGVADRERTGVRGLPSARATSGSPFPSCLRRAGSSLALLPGRPSTTPASAVEDEVDAWLARRARSGSRVAEQAFVLLLRRHQDRMYRIALHVTGSPTDAADIVRDVAVLVRRTRIAFAGSSGSTWLYRAVVDRCSGGGRPPRAVEQHAEERVVTAPPVTTDLARRGHDPDRVETAAQALAALPVEQRAVLVLCQIEGLSSHEAAAITGEWEADLRAHLVRGRKNLVAAMREWT